MKKILLFFSMFYVFGVYSIEYSDSLPAGMVCLQCKGSLSFSSCTARAFLSTNSSLVYGHCSSCKRLQSARYCSGCGAWGYYDNVYEIYTSYICPTRPCGCCEPVLTCPVHNVTYCSHNTEHQTCGCDIQTCEYCDTQVCSKTGQDGHTSGSYHLYHGRFSCSFSCGYTYSKCAVYTESPDLDSWLAAMNSAYSQSSICVYGTCPDCGKSPDGHYCTTHGYKSTECTSDPEPDEKGETTEGETTEGETTEGETTEGDGETSTEGGTTEGEGEGETTEGGTTEGEGDAEKEESFGSFSGSSFPGIEQINPADLELRDIDNSSSINDIENISFSWIDNRLNNYSGTSTPVFVIPFSAVSASLEDGVIDFSKEPMVSFVEIVRNTLEWLVYAFGIFLFIKITRSLEF